MYNEHYLENTRNLLPIHLPCGGTAYFDDSSGISYRCEDCGSVVGSIGQPQSCKEEAKKYEDWKTLGGVGWDYFEGQPEIKKVTK